MTSAFKNACKKANISGEMKGTEIDIGVQFTEASCCPNQIVHIQGSLSSDGKSFQGKYNPKMDVPESGCFLSFGDAVGTLR